jgi:hypothetical protein
MGPNLHPQHTSRRSWTRCGALAAVVLAGVVAGCGTSSSPATDVAGPAAAVGVGSDQHLLNLAAEAATPATENVGSDQHLLNLAAEAARGSTG